MRKTILLRSLLFIFCSALSLLSWYSALIIIAPTISFMGVSDKKLGSPEIVFVLFCLAFPFILFTFVAWFFRKDFGNFSALFVCSPFLLIFAVYLAFQYQTHLSSTKYQNENPENGTVEKNYNDERYGKLRQIVTYKNHKINGERIVYCANEAVLFKGNFEDGKEIGEHFKREGGCNALEGDFTINIYQPAGEVIETKKYEANQLMYHFFRDSDYRNNGTYTQMSYQWNAEKTKLFLAGEIVSIKWGEKQINRKYDENGKLASEKILPEVFTPPTNKITK